LSITRSNDAPEATSCHLDYIQFSPSSWAPHQAGNTAALDFRAQTPARPTEPTSERRDDEADKHFQTEVLDDRVTVGAALVGVVTGHPIQVVKETGGRVIEDAAAVVEWVGGWF
jgi:hypothetical protein